MQNLKETQPGMHEEFLKGHFATRRVDGSFNMLPPDQVIEQTINKEQKGAGGTSAGMVQRWILSSHITAALITNLRLSLGMVEVKSIPKDLGEKRIKHDEAAVQNCYDVIRLWGGPIRKE